MKRLFVLVLLCVFMAVMPSFHAVAEDNQTCDGRIENYVSATGTVVQNGTPSPTNPIEPIFYQQGDMILRKVGNIADSYDATTGKITRRIGVTVFNGTENWSRDGNTTWFYFGGVLTANSGGICTHGKVNKTGGGAFGLSGAGYIEININKIGIENSADAIKQWLAQQYAAGTPVVVYYPLNTETTEDIGTIYCVPEIKIATTAYNAARFSPVKTDLDSAVATIREIVTKTINQTAAIASLQADKQTRPEDACPAGKKCLLVETEENGVIVPHWFPIIEAPEE